MKKRESIIAFAVTVFLFLIICGLLSMAGVGSGITWWLNSGRTEGVTTRPTRILALAESSPAPTFSPTPSATLIPTYTATFVSTATPTSTPVPPTSTAIPPTETPINTATTTPPPLPTATDTPAPTPAPAFSFDVLEFEKFSTNHLNFDVYVAVTDSNNKPLGGYRMLGRHSDGMQVDSEVSANRWTQNSGAMHYKAGNIKVEVSNSPGGVWILQLVDEAGQLAAPPLEFPFDSANPTWYFVLLRQR